MLLWHPRLNSFWMSIVGCAASAPVSNPLTWWSSLGAPHSPKALGITDWWHCYTQVHSISQYQKKEICNTWKTSDLTVVKIIVNSRSHGREREKAGSSDACLEKEKRKRINYCPWVDCPQLENKSVSFGLGLMQSLWEIHTVSIFVTLQLYANSIVLSSV